METRFINKRTVLEEMRDMAWNNVLSYSANYAMTEPKDGMREEWEQAMVKAKIIDQMLDELPGHSQIDKISNSRRYYRKYIGYISGWSCSATRTENPHPYIELVDFKVYDPGSSVFDADTRLFHINHELGVGYIHSGQYDIDRHERYDDGKDSMVQITVDSLNYIQEMRWADDE